MSAEKNLNLKKTSFLSKTNSSFIEQMYIKYINEEMQLRFGKKIEITVTNQFIQSKDGKFSAVIKY